MSEGIWVRRGRGKGYLVFERHDSVTVENEQHPRHDSKFDSIDAAFWLLVMLVGAVATVRELAAWWFG